MLCEAVEIAFIELDQVTLRKCFQSLQSVMEQAVLNKGGNEYKIPHLGTDTLQRSKELPETLVCSVEAVIVAKAAREEVVI
ncbi:hypothetical protein GN244_ATG16065 [Phytophthora infestans]|uniref:Uncharacterized protein n=1 Tax=Phytophthora infestans TaxID=4787 RepID=A0A833W7Q3_PHYIN|nr:hypothetical protein GN244_ATG16065 [Phytophthora infestans]KAF4147244.1 hypothetical protein GN958_ATG03654 [Phytophthora infestans]